MITTKDRRRLQAPSTFYRFSRGQAGLFVEVYFPKRVAFQGTIFDALRLGHDENEVRRFLSDRVELLCEDFGDYPGLLDPDRYEPSKVRNPSEPSHEKALRRIKTYEPVFHGWSMYEVDGVFFKKEGGFDEERTQVIRLMFRCPAPPFRKEERDQFRDVIRSMCMYTVAMRGQLDEEAEWTEVARDQFLALHGPWSDAKKRFAEEHFIPIARGVGKWIDDCALFTFGYLVPRFADEVLKTECPEDQIWVTSFADLTINIIALPDEESETRRGDDGNTPPRH